MARFTIEGCLQKEQNRFQLVLLAASRARQLALGSDEAKVPWENDKPPVVALREIEAGNLVEEEANTSRAVNTEE